MQNDIKERKMSIREILLSAWEIYTNQFKPILIITLLVYIPINIALYILGPEVNDLKGLKSYFDAVRLLEGLFGIICTMSIAIIVKKSIEAKYSIEVNWKQSLKQAFSRWGSCLWTNILARFIILGLSILLVIPGIIFLAYYFFSEQVVILKNLGGKDALDYSKSIVKDNWWEVFGFMILIVIANVLIGILIGFTDEFFNSSINISIEFMPEIFNFLIEITSDTIIDIINSYFIVATTLYFINMDSLKSTESLLEIE